jgi:hypothetical protein
VTIKYPHLCIGFCSNRKSIRLSQFTMPYP